MSACSTTLIDTVSDALVWFYCCGCMGSWSMVQMDNTQMLLPTMAVIGSLTQCLFWHQWRKNTFLPWPCDLILHIKPQCWCLTPSIWLVLVWYENPSSLFQNYRATQLHIGVFLSLLHSVMLFQIRSWPTTYTSEVCFGCRVIYAQPQVIQAVFNTHCSDIRIWS